MSVKRRPDTELNHDNWDEETEPEQFGEFEKASEDELKSRVIKTAKRRLGGSDGQKTSVFSTFQGFGSTSGTSSSKPLFQFGNTSTNASSAGSSIFGNSTAAAKPTFSFGNNNGNTTASNITNTTSPNKDANATEKSAEFCTKLKELNKAVLDCIKGHIDSGKICILTPIFKDYMKYVDEIESNEKKTFTFDTKSTTSTQDTTNTKSGLIFGSSESTPAKTNATEDSAKKSTSMFSSVSPPKTESTPMFSFSKPFGSYSGSSAIGATNTASTSGSKPFFSFSQPAKTDSPAATESQSTQKPVDGAEENEEPPKNEFTPVVEEESIYSKHCKVFVKNNDDYASRGTGTLYLKSVQNGKVQLIVRADTNLGNILINVLLGAGIPAKRMGKNNVMLICIPTPDAGPKPSSVLLRVKNEDDADELYAELSKHLK